MSHCALKLNKPISHILMSPDIGLLEALLRRAGRVALRDSLVEAKLPRAMVIKSVTRSMDGSLVVAPTPALLAQVKRTPTLRSAVFTPTTGLALPGSSPELIEALPGLGRVKFLAMSVNFRIPGDEVAHLSGQLTQEETPFGPLMVAVYGYRFEWSNIVSGLNAFFQVLIAWSGPIFALAALIVWTTVRRGLAPPHEAARNANDINIDTINRRLSQRGMPVEIVPLIDALNGALARLDDGVARERRFLANAAHELRTPIAILRARVDNPMATDLRTDLRRSLRQLQTIVEQLLVSARVAARRDVSHLNLDLRQTALSIVADYTPLIMESGRHIEFEGPAAPPVMVHGDRVAMECVTRNLVNNALSAEPENGAIIVRLSEDAVLEVIDHGPGIEKDDREVIFEPFWRKSEAIPGAGLGLAITKELVEKLEGRIWVDPTPGGGSTLKISLPMMEKS